MIWHPIARRHYTPSIANSNLLWAILCVLIAALYGPIVTGAIYTPLDEKVVDLRIDDCERDGGRVELKVSRGKVYRVDCLR